MRDWNAFLKQRLRPLVKGGNAVIVFPPYLWTRNRIHRLGSPFWTRPLQTLLSGRGWIDEHCGRQLPFKSRKTNCGSGLCGDSAPVLDVKASCPQKGREELPTLQREGRSPCAVRAFLRGALRCRYWKQTASTHSWVSWMFLTTFIIIGWLLIKKFQIIKMA